MSKLTKLPRLTVMYDLGSIIIVFTSEIEASLWLSRGCFLLRPDGPWHRLNYGEKSDGLNAFKASDTVDIPLEILRGYE